MVLMEHLPLVGWADVSTKRDLGQLSGVLRLEFRTELHREVGGLRSKFANLQRNLFFGMLTAQTAFAALIIAVLG